jgi:hypothetical protein
LEDESQQGGKHSMLDKYLKRAEPIRLPRTQVSGLHAGIRGIAQYVDARYLAAETSIFTADAIRWLQVSEPVILACIKTRYWVIGGFRTWHLLQRIPLPDTEMSAILIPGRLNDESVRAIAVHDLLVRRLLTSLDRTGAGQIDQMVGGLDPDYRRPAPGRPPRQTNDPADTSFRHFFNASLSTERLARCMAMSPSSLRRARGAR